LVKNGFTEDQIISTLPLFNNNIELVRKFLIGQKQLQEVGFSELQIKEALFMNNNDTEKAIQYLLDNPK
jgi:uncharacterized UBP type Zn finger protein